MLTQDVKVLMHSLGADLCGIASADAFTGAPEGYHPRDVLPQCRSVIVFAKRFLRASLSCNTQIPYTIVRNLLSSRLDAMAVDACLALELAGHAAVPTGTIGPTERDPKTGRSRNIVSAKHSAALAGLGWIGRNTLLINPLYGNMVWLGVLLTDADLTPDAQYRGRVCPDNCTRCVQACPVQALGEPEMNQQACWDHAFGDHQGAWQLRCNKCRTVCPYVTGVPG